MDETQFTIDFKDLLEKAKETSVNAYAPYSNFQVGAAVLYGSGNVYVGVNVENVSYGLTICAERNAIAGAISQGEHSKLTAVAVFSPNQKMCFPCGACRQWLSEFGGSLLKVVVEDESGNPKVFELSELLPHSFNFF